MRDTYIVDDYMIAVTTDRQSAFDRHLASIPFKGAVLNQTSAWWFEKTKDIVPNAWLSSPDPNVTVMKKCEVRRHPVRDQPARVYTANRSIRHTLRAYAPSRARASTPRDAIDTIDNNDPVMDGTCLSGLKKNNKACSERNRSEANQANAPGLPLPLLRQDPDARCSPSSSWCAGT